MARAKSEDRPAATGPARPHFAATYPRSPALEELLRLFEAGDYGAVRTAVAKLLVDSKDEDERLAAIDLRRRLSPAPLTVLLFALSVGLLALLAFHYLGVPH